MHCSRSQYSNQLKSRNLDEMVKATNIHLKLEKFVFDHVSLVCDDVRSVRATTSYYFEFEVLIWWSFDLFIYEKVVRTSYKVRIITIMML